MSHIVNYQWSFSLSQFDFAHSNIVILLNSKLSSHILYRQIKSLINLAEKTCENAVLYTKTIYNSLSWWPRTQQWSKYIRVQKYTSKTTPSVVVQFDGEKTIFGRDVSQKFKCHDKIWDKLQDWKTFKQWCAEFKQVRYGLMNKFR